MGSLPTEFVWRRSHLSCRLISATDRSTQLSLSHLTVNKDDASPSSASANPASAKTRIRKRSSFSSLEIDYAIIALFRLCLHKFVGRPGLDMTNHITWYSNQDELMGRDDGRDELMDGATVLRQAHLAGNKRVVFIGMERADAVSSTRETVAFGTSLDSFVAQLTKWNTKSGQDFLSHFLHGQNAQDYWFCLKSVSRIKANDWQTRKLWRIIIGYDAKSLTKNYLEEKLEYQVAHAIKRSLGKREENQGEQEMEGVSVSSPVSEETQDEQELEASDVPSPVSEETEDEQELEALRFLDMPIRPGHAEFLKRIRLATDVTDFEILYNELDFMIGEVDRAQLTYENRWNWCVAWAKARHFGQAWADVYEMHRKTVLKLLEYLWRRYEPDVEDPADFKTLTVIDVCKEFGTDKIDRILKIFLPMDKANAFYKMSPSKDKKDPPGLAWYCKLHGAQELRDRGVTENPNGRGPLNRRYVQLWKLSNQYLNYYGKKPIGESWKHLMVPEMPPNDASPSP